MRTASPHTRGWTSGAGRGSTGSRGFPAHAGMDLVRRPRLRLGQGLPRTRGDGPLRDTRLAALDAASPHTRGWTPLMAIHTHIDRGFPAHAGMDPCPPRHPVCARGLPRTRGDGPSGVRRFYSSRPASPHTRGWTLAPVNLHRHFDRAGFPAHAGMDRRSSTVSPPEPRLPRTRGDGPFVLPEIIIPTTASPHTRGWTLRKAPSDKRLRGFPAHAGMDPASRARPGPPERASPHTRG